MGEHEALARKESGTVVKRRTSKTERELVGNRLTYRSHQHMNYRVIPLHTIPQVTLM